MTRFCLEHLISRKAPPPAVKFSGLAKYNFIGGHNALENIPVAGLMEAARRALARDGELLAFYNLSHGPQGYAPLREIVREKLRTRRGIDCTIDDVLITSGSSQGLELVFALFLDQGDTVIIEEFTYAGVIPKLRKLEANIVGAPLSDDGLDMDKLESILEEKRTTGKPVRMVYTIPTIQNPTGTIMSLKSRLRLIDLARQYGFVIFEDDCYADLVWQSASTPTSIYGLAPDLTVHVGSFSKTLAPAVRVAYVLADWTVLSRLLALKTDAGTGAIDQMVVAEYFRGNFDAHVKKINSVLEEKLAIMVDAVDAAFGSAVSYKTPAGGIFLWLKFPDSVDVRKLIEPAAKQGVVFNAGPEWAADAESATPWMRLCFALPSRELITEGVRLLADVCFAETGFPTRSNNFSRTRQ